MRWHFIPRNLTVIYHWYLDRSYICREWLYDGTQT